MADNKHVEGSNQRFRLSSIRSHLYREKRLTFPNKEEQKFSFLWKKEWVNKFESPWSVYTKFQFYNYTDEKEFFQLFGGPEVKKLKGRISDGHKFMYSLTSFDNAITKKILGYSSRTNQKMINLLINPLQDTLDQGSSFMSKYLRFCPICIKDKYHSTFQQFIFLKLCPIHNEPLSNECPNCKVKYTYSIFDANFKSPYECKCGFTYSTTKKINKMSIKIKDKQFLEWISISSKALVKNLRIFSEFNTPIHEYTENDFIYTVKDLLNLQQKKVLIKSKIEPDLITKHTIDNYKNSDWYNYAHFEQELYIDTNTIMNSIARNLRKNLLKKHIRCIKDYTMNAQQGLAKGYCPYAIAYVNWRRRLQRYRGDSAVDNWGTVPLSRERISYFGFPIVTGYYFLRDLIYDHISTFETENHGYYSLRWIINRYVAEMVYSDFKRCLIEAESYMKIGKVNIDFLDGYSYIPKLALVQIEDSPIQYGFYKTGSVKMGETTKNLNCPNLNRSKK